MVKKSQNLVNIVCERTLKVSKSRKQKYFFSILPKNEQKTFALVGRSNFGKYFVRFLGESRTVIFLCIRPNHH